jgi:hypothetical protein
MALSYELLEDIEPATTRTGFMGASRLRAAYANSAGSFDAPRHKNSLWRQTAVVLPPTAGVNLFLTSTAAKNSKRKTTKAAGLAVASFCTSNGAGK